MGAKTSCMSPEWCRGHPTAEVINLSVDSQQFSSAPGFRHDVNPCEEDLVPPDFVGHQVSAGTLQRLVIMERVCRKGTSSSNGSTAEGSLANISARGSSASTGSRSRACRAMAVLQVASALAVPPEKVDKSRLAAFSDALENAGLDLERWGVSGTKSVEHLFWEAYQQRGCFITGLTGGVLKRVTRLVKIRLTAEIFGVTHTLFSRMQFMHDGQTIERRQVPLRRLVWKPALEQEMGSASPEVDKMCYEEQCPYTEDWRTGCQKALEERLGLSLGWQQKHLEEEPQQYSYTTEDNVVSDGYPGLNTLYCIHEVTFRVLDPEHPAVGLIGLPQGQEFATTEGDFNFNGTIAEDHLPIGTQLNIWTWARDSKAQPGTPRRFSGGDLPLPMAQTGSQPRPPKGSSVSQEEERAIMRVPLSASAPQAIAKMQARIMSLESSSGVPPAPALHAAMKDMRTNWDKVKSIAKNILDPKYTLDKYNQDLSAFPELNLYLFPESNGDAGPGAVGKTSSMSSGRTIGDEYQRTVGCFYAIYWLLRLQADGKEGFSFGVDSNWTPIGLGETEKQPYPKDKRVKFYHEGKWDHFKQLFIDAGLLKEERRLFGRGSVLKVNEKRVVSLLALTAIHDIMKMAVLLPEVQEKNAPYHGYAAGDTISDHDHALSYLMDHYPELLPSFRDLDPEEKRAVHFTQCNLCFNHGWFVQAEAPPGAVFTKFRDTLIRDHKSQVGKQDVALYFVHWLTDLAGAEPTPLGGCEKFVVKFPLEVLNSFLRSFEYVQKITEHTETEVMEEYLKVRWIEHTPSPGPLPTGDSAIAKMRILCMAQTKACLYVRAFDELEVEDQEVLSVELARTGTLCQSYSHDLVPHDVHVSPAGPAFLVYYGPAFLQNLGSDDPKNRLWVLAEVYRRARELWATNVAKAAANVIIRVDMIKSLTLDQMIEATAKGDVWLMMKHNESEAFIERCSKRKLNKLIASGQHIQILDLSGVCS